MRRFKTKTFARFARRAGIDDRSLCEAVERAEIGLIAADLGGGLIKQRVARELAVFLFGFSKSEWTISLMMI